jgi:DNA-binding Lrp family transcriptional regulator
MDAPGGTGCKKPLNGMSHFGHCDTMAVGFVLITTESQKELAVYELINSIPEVKELHPLFGEYDMIAKVETQEFDDLAKIVIDKIRNVEGVTDTKTLGAISFNQ